jgi:hypothetical protein
MTTTPRPAPHPASSQTTNSAPPPAGPKPRRLSLWLGLILALPLPAQADTLWVCVLSAEQTRLACLADDATAVETDPAAQPAVEPAPELLSAPAPRHGTRYPLDTRRRQEVDLLGPAADLDFVEQLAQATMCGRTPRCRAWLSRPGARPLPTAWLPARPGG